MIVGSVPSCPLACLTARISAEETRTNDKHDTGVATSFSSVWADLRGCPFSQDWLDVGGVRTRVLSAGDASLPPLIPLHGTGGHAEAYARNLGAHAEHFRTLSVDMIGHCWTDLASRGVEIEHYVNHVLRFIDTIGIERAHFSGESLGAWMASRIAADHPDRVERLVLNTAGGSQTDPKVMNQIRTLSQKAADDPVGTPNLYLRCDPARPTVSIALPHGVRRFEFMVFAHETDEAITAPAVLQALMAREVPDPAAVRLIRSRVYTHHARLAARFRQGRVMLAGDAAHLMPVWQGQGYNSGLRDATNLGWKLAAVLNGLSDDALLDTYQQERRQHAAAMIALSVTAGRIFSPSLRKG